MMMNNTTKVRVRPQQSPLNEDEAEALLFIYRPNYDCCARPE